MTAEDTSQAATKGSDDKPNQMPTQVAISQAQLFGFDPATTRADVALNWYSNFAFVSAGPRDLWIDFLQVPGIPQQGQTVVPTCRVYLSHVAAEKLAQALLQVLRDAAAGGRLEKLGTG
jgi:hypothetical protein